MQILQHGDTGGMACGLSSAGAKSQIRRFFIGKSTSPRKRITLLQEITSLVNIISFGQSEAKCAGGKAVKKHNTDYLLIPSPLSSIFPPTRIQPNYGKSCQKSESKPSRD